MLHARLDPASNTGATVLATHFNSQLAPDIRRKFKKAKDGPQTPIRDLVNMAFNGFNNREAEAEAARQACLQQKVALQTQAMLAALRLAANTGMGEKRKSWLKNAPLGACFKCCKRTLDLPVSSALATNKALPRLPTAWPLEGCLSP